MKKSIQKIFIILVIAIAIFTMVEINYSYASEGSISVPSVTVGQDFTVTVNIPSDAVAYEGKISVTFSDGTSKSSGKLTKVTGIEGDYAHPGNMSFTFNAVKEGNALVKVIGLIISSKSGQINQNETLEKNITIASNAPTTPSEPTTPEVPTTPSEPTTEPEKPNTPTEPTWNATGDTVYALEDLNVRSGWGTSYNKIGSLKKSASTKRIAVGSNGWDKIDYNGTTGYVMSKYLTTQKPEDNTQNNEPDNTSDSVKEPTWRATGDTVYALQKLNVRSGSGTSFKAIGMLKKNDKVKRIAVGSNGWDKIDYNGTIGYVMSKYLTTEKPEENEIENNVVKNEISNNLVENTNIVENNIVNSAEIYNTIVDEVGVIPPVGRNIVDYIYIIAVCVSIGMIGFVGIKIRENNKE